MRVTVEKTSVETVGIMLCDQCGKEIRRGNVHTCEICKGEYCDACSEKGHWYKFDGERVWVCEPCVCVAGPHSDAIEQVYIRADTDHADHIDEWKHDACCSLERRRALITRQRNSPLACPGDDKKKGA